MSSGAAGLGAARLGEAWQGKVDLFCGQYEQAIFTTEMMKLVEVNSGLVGDAINPGLYVAPKSEEIRRLLILESDIVLDSGRAGHGRAGRGGARQGRAGRGAAGQGKGSVVFGSDNSEPGYYRIAA